ncbi:MULTISPECIES: putative quinol monooxygenase [unclassified Tenacibaculum]|uniref:putative quinol monooxygenase n=1 Tax=unclassified Tenacibaculum TaxID=2635139 RepID=UPI001F3522D0|nr:MULTISPECIES: putative quinol monooxygenase [unclassified Tenacibaculum]MCF2875232.1 antibiotic biosynthesis monooxygenase [Tenacibaculum sp. Cn5-1]MCF2935308.1 antibiotic biosynthesis monooxygenase [Tenacibaculum sp. Cn5-34]MCG7511250.1 antibiotic biosynthesis monooxygenase [Tenacibaculum sp. Cn5-46]
MIALTVKSRPKKENKEDFINAFYEIVDEVNKEDGCLEYELYLSTRNQEEVFLFERWESKEKQEKHMQTNHMIAFFEKIQPWFDQETEMKIYNIK